MYNENTWKNEFEYNLYIARKILLPLSGGNCLVNNDHERALKESREHEKKEVPLLLPHEFGWKGLGMAKENFAVW